MNKEELIQFLKENLRVEVCDSPITNINGQNLTEIRLWIGDDLISSDEFLLNND